MARLMFIDGNSIGYANQYSHTMVSQGMEVQAIIGTIRSIRKHISEHPNHFPVVIWDGRAQWRYDLYPDYKSARLKSEKSRAAREAYEKQQPALRTMLAKLGIVQAIAQDAEADDVGFQLGRPLAKMGHEVLHVTRDTDVIVALCKGASWLDPVADRLISTAAELEAHVGTKRPRTYLEAKALEGDTSDTIGGVHRVGIATALKVFAKHGGSMEAFYAEVEAGRVDLKKKTLNSLASAEGRAIFARNMKLMDLASAPPLSAQEIVITREPLDSVVFGDWAEHFAFTAVLKHVGEFLAPFEHATNREGYTELMQAVASLVGNRSAEVSCA